MSIPYYGRRNTKHSSSELVAGNGLLNRRMLLGRDAILAQWQKQHEKGKLDAEQRDALSSRLLAVDSMQDLAGCDLVVEAVVEDLEIKRRLFLELEAVIAPSATLVTNTSSLSVTAIAAALKHPERMAGFHFFNPYRLGAVHRRSCIRGYSGS